MVKTKIAPKPLKNSFFFNLYFSLLLLKALQERKHRKKA